MSMSMSVLRVAVAILLAALPVVSQVPQIVSGVPAANGNNALPAGPISVAFSTNLNPATVNAANVYVFGRWSGVASGVLSVVGGNTIHFEPSGPFSCGELVTMYIGTGVRSASGTPVPATLTHTFWTAAAPANWGFNLVSTTNVRLPGEGHIQTYGAYAGDLNNDGYPDLSMTNEVSSDVRIFMNDGTGGFLPFTIHNLPGGSVPSPIVGADLNRDGWTDFVTANQNGTVAVFMNDGAGGILPAVIYFTNGAQPRGLELLDANSDGNIDILTANRGPGTLSLLLGNGNGTFGAAMVFQGGVSNETSLAIGDANGDGIQDVFVGGYNSQNIALLLGDGAGNFTMSATMSTNGRPWMLMAGDVDGDGNVDCVAATSNTGDASVVRSDGAGGLFPAVNYSAGSLTIAIDLGDLDGDGDLDMMASNYSSDDFTVWRNNGNGTFAPPLILPAVNAGSCALVVDIDGDGKTELLGIDEMADLLFIWETPPPLVQRCSPMACLAIDGVTTAAGFGFLAPAAVPVGSTPTFTISGHPNQAFLAAVGLRLDPGQSTVAGTLNLNLGLPWVRLLDGFAGGCTSCATDADGNYQLPFNFSGVPVGVSFSAQFAIMNPANLASGLTLSNPLRLVTTL